MVAAPSHSFEDHTAEVLLRVRASTLADLYAEAAHALAELLAEDPGSTVLGEPEHVEVRAGDREALLVAWIDELVYRAETTGRVFPVVQVDAVDGQRLEATIRGGPPATWRTAVKAATWHRLRVVDEPDGGLSSTIVLDV